MNRYLQLLLSLFGICAAYPALPLSRPGLAAGGSGDPVRISWLRALPSPSNSRFAYQAGLTNSSGQAHRVTIAAQLRSADPHRHWTYPALSTIQAVVPPHGSITVASGQNPWRAGRASWWWPNVPYTAGYHAVLHLLMVRLSVTGAAAQQETVRFGFCRPAQSGERYRFNGVPFHLRGDNLPGTIGGVSAFHRLAGFLPPSHGNPGWPAAVRNYQRMNINVICNRGQPFTEYMLRVCDALGLLVIEAPANDDSPPPDGAAYVESLRRLVERDRNHPCLFKWSFGTAGRKDFNAQFTLYKTCMQADGSRPCSFDGPANDLNLPDFLAISGGTSSGSPASASPAPQPTTSSAAVTTQAAKALRLGENLDRLPSIALAARAAREAGAPDLRPFELTTIWPDVIPGLSHGKAQGEGAIRFPLTSPAVPAIPGSDPWNGVRIRLLQRSFAPVAAFDREFDSTNQPSNGEGEWPAAAPALPAGRTVTRAIDLLNDDLAGDSLKVVFRSRIVDTTGKPQPGPGFARNVTVPCGGRLELALPLALPFAQSNEMLDASLTVFKDGVERYREDLPYTIVAKGGARVEYSSRDDSTQGNWHGRYGKESFLVPVTLGSASYNEPQVSIRRGNCLSPSQIRGAGVFGPNGEEQDALVNFETAQTSTDLRVQQGPPGEAARVPTAFCATFVPMLLRVDAGDGALHRLSLYLLDYHRAGQSVDINFYDLQGHRMESREVSNFGNGAYIRYLFRGSFIIEIVPLGRFSPTLSGIFIDPAPGKLFKLH